MTDFMFESEPEDEREDNHDYGDLLDGETPPDDDEGDA